MMEPNKAQRRSTNLNKDLSNLNTDDLLTFLDGVESPEPPTYRFVEGVIQPPLVHVTLKEGANSYDFGNVICGQNGGISVKHVIAQIEKGSCKLLRGERLPEDEGSLLSHPIQYFVFEELFELWKEKFQVIVDTKDKINALRTFAHNLPLQPRRRSINGQDREMKLTIRLKAPEPNQDNELEDESNSAKPLKRKPGEPIAQHTCNKRSKVGLDVSPATKIDAVSNIPDQVKIDFFDAVAEASMPNYPVSVNNVLMAGWNVISIFTHVGTQSLELTKSIVDLKNVLLEFEGGDSGKKKKPKKDENGGTTKPMLASNPESTPAGTAHDSATPRKPSSPTMPRRDSPFVENYSSQETPGSARTPHSRSNITRNGDQNHNGTPTKQVLPHQRRLGALESLQMYADQESDRASRSPQEKRESGRFASPNTHQQKQHQQLHPDLIGLNVGGGSPQASSRAHAQKPSALSAAVKGTKKNDARQGTTPEVQTGNNVGKERERESEKERSRASFFYH